jgi:hypothetical protein
MLKSLCYICGDVASHTCKLCGRPVCDKHYIAALGVCVNCAKGRSFKFDEKVDYKHGSKKLRKQ